MTLQSVREMENTRRKLRDLEQSYDDAVKRPSENTYVREATLTSLRRLINQLKEEIARFEAHQPTSNPTVR